MMTFNADLTASNRVLCELEKLMVQMEQMSPMISSQIVNRARELVADSIPLVSKEDKVLAWKLSYRIWNNCVSIANDMHPGEDFSEDHARLRQIACDLLLQAGSLESIRSSFQKMATFFLKTGVIWHNIRNFSMASVCLEKATELLAKGKGDGDGDSSLQSKEDHQRLFDLYVARARTAWQLSHTALACSLLSRARGLLSVLPEKQEELADLFLQYGKELAMKEDKESKADSLRYMDQAFEICSSCDGMSDASTSSPICDLRMKILRYLAAGHAHCGDFDSVLRCVGFLRLGPDHPSTSYLALRGLAGLGRYDEAERELFVLVSHVGASPEACISGIQILIDDSSRLNAGVRAFLLLQSRHDSNKELPVRIIEILLRQMSTPHTSSRENEKNQRAAAAVEIASNDNVLSTVTGTRAGIQNISFQSSSESHGSSERDCIHALLWNSGSDQFQSKDYNASIKLFEASMLYIPLDEENNAQRAKSLRVLCLCHLGLMEYERAAECVNEAAKLDPSIACSFLKFKIYLQNQDEDAAKKQVELMVQCQDFEPDYLTLASHEAVTCQFPSVAIAAMAALLELNSEKKGQGARDVVLMRNTIHLALQGSGDISEALKYCKLAQKRLAEAGPEGFFGAGNIGTREANWFACTCWNQGLLAAKSHKWSFSADFFACASDFFDAVPLSEAVVNLKTSLLLTASSLIVMDSADEGCLKKAARYLEWCRKVCRTQTSSADQSDALFQTHLHLLDFDLKGRFKDYNGQIDILLHCASLPNFKSCDFLKMAFHSHQTKDVTTTAFRMSLKSILATSAPDYKIVATVLRQLICLEDLEEKDGPKVLAIYSQAKDLLLGLSSGEYPVEEIQWLVATSWNRAALHIKFQRWGDAAQWMALALELLKYAPCMESRRSIMMASLSGVRKNIAETHTV